jgi:hypothetical protein
MVMAVNAQTMTNANSAKVPISLRLRSDIGNLQLAARIGSSLA